MNELKKVVIMEDYEKKYKSLVEAVKTLKDANPSDDGIQNWIKDNVPELKESEDEMIRKWLISQLKIKSDDTNSDLNIMINKVISWLEKQGKKTMDCSQNHQDSRRPNGCIVLADFNEGEGFYKLHLNYLSKKQVEEVEELVRVWNHEESKTPNEDIKNCIGMCLTDVDEQRFTDYNTSLKECLAWLEKQGKQNPAWSEEDEKILSDIIKDLVHPWNGYIPDRIEDEIKWLRNKLKSLRP
jgi:hypothetical protein